MVVDGGELGGGMWWTVEAREERSEKRVEREIGGGFDFEMREREVTGGFVGLEEERGYAARVPMELKLTRVT
jgi:hypothetical protein